MKKVVETFVCDCCGEPLPDKFVKKNGIETTYFDNRRYNTIQYAGGSSITVDIVVDISEYGPTYKEFCNKCRVKYLQQVLEHMQKGGDV